MSMLFQTLVLRRRA